MELAGQADADDNTTSGDGSRLTTAEKKELTRLRRSKRRLESVPTGL